jgi:hypothetical protein
MEKEIQIPMSRGRSTKSSRKYSGFGPVGCQQRSLSLTERGSASMSAEASRRFSPGGETHTQRASLVFGSKGSGHKIQGSGFRLEG